MPKTTETTDLPERAAMLLALARVAHRNGDRKLERAACDRLVSNFGIQVSFVCADAVERDLREAEGAK